MHTFGHRKFSSFTFHVRYIDSKLLNIIEFIIKMSLFKGLFSLADPKKLLYFFCSITNCFLKFHLADNHH